MIVYLRLEDIKLGLPRSVLVFDCVQRRDLVARGFTLDPTLYIGSLNNTMACFHHRS